MKNLDLLFKFPVKNILIRRALSKDASIPKRASNFHQIKFLSSNLKLPEGRCLLLKNSFIWIPSRNWSDTENVPYLFDDEEIKNLREKSAEGGESIEQDGTICVGHDCSSSVSEATFNIHHRKDSNFNENKKSFLDLRKSSIILCGQTNYSEEYDHNLSVKNDSPRLDDGLPNRQIHWHPEVNQRTLKYQSSANGPKMNRQSQWKNGNKAWSHSQDLTNKDYRHNMEISSRTTSGNAGSKDVGATVDTQQYLEISDDDLKSSDKYPGDENFLMSKEGLESLTEKQKQKYEATVLEIQQQIKKDIFLGTSYLKIPRKITDEMWMVLMDCTSKSAWKKRLKFYFIKECRRDSEKKKKELKRELREQNQVHTDESPSSVGHYLYLYNFKPQYKAHAMQRGINALRYGNPFVIDLRYINIMTVLENSLTHQQLFDVVHCNREHPDPYHLVFCNNVKDKQILKKVEEMWGMQEFYTVNYTDLYPREKLVYLSPHSNNVLEKFDHDDIYIMAAYTDKHDNKPVSMHVARKDDVRTVSLPLTKHLGMRGPDIVLTLDQVMKIMLDLKSGKDWQTALQHVPKRKVARVQAPSSSRRHLASADRKIMRNYNKN